MESTILLTSQDVTKQEPIKLFSPQNPTPFEIIFLSNIDQAVVFPVETVFFFRVSESSESSSTVGVCELVKRAVSEELLVPYYCLAGRLSFNHGSKRLELLCNNGGVLFVGAESRLAMEELGDLSLPNPNFHHFVHRPGLYKSLDETPLLTIQVTTFKCGGFALGFMTNHSILDGKSASEMFHNLASICRGEGLKTLPIHAARTRFQARNPPQIKFPHPEYLKPPGIASRPTSFSTHNQTSPSPLIFSGKVFPFSQAILCSLKLRAAVAGCSSFDVVVGQIWKARTMAVFGNDEVEESSAVLFAVDVRSRLSPPLPPGFTGNAVVTAYAAAKVGEVVEKPLSFCVEKVREARERVTEEYVRSAIDWLEVHRGIPATGRGGFYVSAWWKLTFEELDLGYGKAVHGGPVVSGNDEFVLLLSNDAGGINVWLGLEREKMERFAARVYDM
ncbi:Omega-hydroxypalmitate O-feruloyl transferase [Bertholletia excelsa]